MIPKRFTTFSVCDADDEYVLRITYVLLGVLLVKHALLLIL